MKKYILIVVILLVHSNLFSQKLNSLTNRYKFENCEQAKEFANKEITFYENDSQYILKYFRHKIFDKSISASRIKNDSILLEKYRIKIYDVAIWSETDSCYIKEVYSKLNHLKNVDLIQLINKPIK